MGTEGHEQGQPSAMSSQSRTGRQELIREGRGHGQKPSPPDFSTAVKTGQSAHLERLIE
jgi:hypothetical protein